MNDTHQHDGDDELAIYSFTAAPDQYKAMSRLEGDEELVMVVKKDAFQAGDLSYTTHRIFDRVPGTYEDPRWGWVDLHETNSGHLIAIISRREED